MITLENMNTAYAVIGELIEAQAQLIQDLEQDAVSEEILEYASRQMTALHDVLELLQVKRDEIREEVIDTTNELA